MFRHILVPTDGSALSSRAVLEAVKLARLTGAQLTGLHVAPQFMPEYEGESASTAASRLDRDEQTYQAQAAAHARRCLSVVEREAAAGGVEADTIFMFDDSPAQAILDAAASHGCDCIVMASHGRRGLANLLIGSETHKVLTHGGVPVLVVR